MVRLSRIMVLSCVMVFIMGGLSSLAARDNKSETIKPSGIHEDCTELVPGETLDYFFNASRPLNFNVHYHEDHNVVYVITKDGVSSDKGTFRCEKKQYYCLMWTNSGSESVSLTYSYSTEKK
ncbi:MAG TPA: hypothetical protein VEI46_00970 [Thermodesulfovibrionales bacterium]|nr:hypothetical protein [Thermodesulfovibrionales bacterium]